MTTERIDVLAVMDAAEDDLSALGYSANETIKQLRKARAAVAELIEAARLVNADHSAPHDCYATGPMTGDPYLDLVRCPGCQLAAALARVGAP